MIARHRVIWPRLVVLVLLCAVAMPGGAWAAPGDVAPWRHMDEPLRPAAGFVPAGPFMDLSALRVASLATGSSHTCALLESGGGMCWGSNGDGQIGDGTMSRRDSATAVLGLDQGAIAVAAGGGHTCALMQDRTLRCWGNNGSGQLGDGAKTDHTLPVAVQGLSKAITAISLGDSHTCALDVDGGVWCWGENYNGQLGDGGMDDRTLPALVGGLASASAVAAGRDHTCALAQGQAYCWGSNTQGQLGDGTDTRRRQPVPVVGLDSGAAAIAAGSSHTCAITPLGAVMCWGDNHYGQLGDGTTSDRYTPVGVVGLTSGVQQIATGGSHACALRAGGLTCWGYNWEGQVGDGATGWVSPPVTVWGLGSGVSAVDAGSIHTCALTTNAGAKCWGCNYSGQLGTGTHLGGEYTPVDVVGLEGGAAADPLTLLDDLSLRTEGGHWPPRAGDEVIAHIRMRNTSGGPLHVAHLGVRGRRNGSENWDIGFWAMDLAAGQEWTLDPNNERPLEAGSYAFRISYSLDGATWTEIGNEVTFVVQEGSVTPEPSPPPQTTRAWTLMYYFAADNDLENCLSAEYRDLSYVNNPNANVLAFFDGRGSEARYHVLSADGPSETLRRGELNTGVSSALSDFVSWAKASYPAEHYALIISDHGHPSYGVGTDEHPRDKGLTPKELRAALAPHGGFDVIFMANCLMANIEAAYQLRGLGEFYVATESIYWLPVPHWDYVRGITRATTPEELALAMAKRYRAHIGEMQRVLGTLYAGTISVTRLSHVEAVALSANNLARALRQNLATTGLSVWSILKDTVQRFDGDASGAGKGVIDASDWLADLYHFALLVGWLDNPAISDAATDLCQVLDTYIVYNDKWSNTDFEARGGYTHNYNLDHAYGVSITLSTVPIPFYAGYWLDFAEGTDWGTSGASSLAASEPYDSEWGMLMVELIATHNPGSAPVVEPPSPVAPGTWPSRVLLPCLRRDT